MMVLDASVIIAVLDADDAHHDAAKCIFTGELDDLGVNSLTLAEVLVGPARAGCLDAARAALHDLEIAELPFPENTASKLSELRVSTGLRMPDCCVLLAAEQSAALVATFDQRLSRAATDRDLRVVPR